jgi:hypothetical protein
MNSIVIAILELLEPELKALGLAELQALAAKWANNPILLAVVNALIAALNAAPTPTP